MLSPAVYDSLQTFINKDFSFSFEYFRSQMQIESGDCVLDIGCGTGLISKQFTDRKINYIGIDLSADRISRAKELNPAADFICGDLRNTHALQDRNVKYVILHGVIHHLSDQEVLDLFIFLKDSGCVSVGTFDPIMPNNAFLKPLAAILCKMDEGKHVRTLDQYTYLFQAVSSDMKYLKYNTVRWPVSILYTVNNLQRQSR